MIYDDDWAEETEIHRLEAIRHSLHSVTLQELVKLGEERFPVVTDPWCDHYNKFLKEHTRDSFYMARFFQVDSEEYVEVIYCKEANNGMWFLPGKGMGILMPDTLARLSKLVDEMDWKDK